MKVSRETSQMRIQQAIAADARMRETVKRSSDWPDPNARTGTTKRHELKPIYVLDPPSPSAKYVAAAKGSIPVDQNGEA